jgi:hypothetical protein
MGDERSAYRILACARAVSSSKGSTSNTATNACHASR